MLAAIFRKSTLLVHYNLRILLIIRIIMDVYRNFPDFHQKQLRNYVILYFDTADSSADIICYFATAKLANFHEVVKPQFLRWN